MKGYKSGLWEIPTFYADESKDFCSNALPFRFFLDKISFFIFQIQTTVSRVDTSILAVFKKVVKDRKINLQNTATFMGFFFAEIFDIPSNIWSLADLQGIHKIKDCFQRVNEVTIV